VALEGDLALVEEDLGGVGRLLADALALEVGLGFGEAEAEGDDQDGRAGAEPEELVGSDLRWDKSKARDLQDAIRGRRC
jgi:hypothetical protein